MFLIHFALHWRRPAFEIAEIYASGLTPLSAQEWTEFYAWHDQYMV